MPSAHETLTQELTALMEAHNRWSARVAHLKRLARDLGEPGSHDPDLEAQLVHVQAELAAAEARAAEWEQKARHLSQLVYKERSDRSRRIRELEQELDMVRRGAAR